MVLSGRVRISSLRKVELEDLLRREPVETDLAAVRGVVSHRVVLITGAGGSIGSELSRQVAQLEPSHLVLLGNGENEILAPKASQYSTPSAFSTTTCLR